MLFFQTDVTVPLFQKALRKDLDVNIIKLLQTVLPDCDSREHEEKDVVSTLFKQEVVGSGEGAERDMKTCFMT